jgi:mono/diheme cytochrome c family protein
MTSPMVLKFSLGVLLASHALAGVAADSASESNKLGEDVYRKVCQACHMPGGIGVKGPNVRIPPLANNAMLGAAAYPVYVVLNGRGAMPWFNGVLTPAQIAAVTNYIRTHFGNEFTPPVTVEDVKQLATAPPASER